MDRQANPENDQAPGIRRLPAVVIVFVLFALAAMALRLYVQQQGAFPAGDRAWSAILVARVYAPEAGALVRIAPPWDTRHARLYGQLLLHPGMRQLRTKTDRRNRDISLVANRAGFLTIKARFDVHVSQVARPESKRQAAADSDRAPWLVAGEGIPVEAQAVTSILDTLTQDAPESEVLVERLFEHVSELVRITPKGSDDGGSVLQQHQATALGATRAMVALLRAAHLPARVVTGLDLSAPADRQPRYWSEVYYQGRWQPLDVAGGHRNELPPAYVPLRKGGAVVLEAEGAEPTGFSWSIQQAETPRGLFSSDNQRTLDILDLTRLSPGTREALALLLLMPLGALSTQVLRNLVGIRTYGTFTPTLLALAAVFVDWLTAATIFALVTVLGVAGRALLPDLELTRDPRLSIVFTLVATIMAMVASLLIYFDPSVDGAVVLLPVVILTTLVDRIYAAADGYGPRIAFLRLGWTIAAALVCLGILLQAHWGEWLLVFPETHAITLAVIILLGRYRGPRLADLRWLGWLREPSVDKKTRQRVSARTEGRKESVEE